MALATEAPGWRDTDAASDSDMSGERGDKAEDHLSPEDSAWVDSCLVKDDDDDDDGEGNVVIDKLSDDAWAALTEAFITALASASATATSSTHIQDEVEAKLVDESNGIFAEREPSRGANASGDGSLMMPHAAAADGFPADAFQLEGESSSSPPSSTASGTYAAATFYDQPSPSSTAAAASIMTNASPAAAVVIGNEFPEEEGQEGYAADAGDDEFYMAAVVDNVELTRDDIFRVWELNVHDDDDDEEDDDGDDGDGFGWQLKKALEGSSSSPVNGVPVPVLLAEHQSGANLADWKIDDRPPPNPESDDESLQQLIAAIDHMSL